MKVVLLHFALFFIIACEVVDGVTEDCSQQISAKKSAKKTSMKADKVYQRCVNKNSEVQCSAELTAKENANKKLGLMVKILKVCRKNFPCNLPPKIGKGKGVLQRWFFNSTAASCETFNYGGSGGNANNFESKEYCGKACTSVCELPAKPGLCEAYFKRWFFNFKKNTCDEFVYGGCDGNANNFKTKKDCEGACSVCELPKEPGPCKGAFPRWFFNSKSDLCKKFTYGGCNGNANNFMMKNECVNMCNPK